MEIVKQLLFGDVIETEDAKTIIDYLLHCSIEDLYSVIEDNISSIQPITSKVIPQFSNIDDVDTVVQIIYDTADSEEINRQYIGYMINKNASELAQTKYGENHFKLALLMGLVNEKPYTVTPLGRLYLELPNSDRKLVRSKLAMRIPLVQYLLVNSKDCQIDGTEYMKTVISEKTAIRRRSNIRKLINDIYELASVELKKQILDNIVWS